MTGMLGYAPTRLAVLARATQEAAAELSAVRTDEPLAADGAATARAAGGALDEALRSSLRAVLSSTALTDWTGASWFLGVGELIALLGDEGWVAAPRPPDPGPFVLDGDDLPLAESVSATDPGQWFHMINPACVAYPGARYRGGGYITDHRGERYPIVVPEVETAEGDVYTADAYPIASGDQSVSELGGNDPGWEVVGTATGVARFQERPSALESFLGGVAATTGLVRPMPPNRALRSISVPLAGLPHFADGPPAVPGPVTLPEGGDGAPDPSDGSRASVIGSSTAVALTVVQGAVMAAAMDNQTERAYRVVFERNPDGRRRARICTYTLAYDHEGEVVIVPEHVYVDGEGRLMSETISYGTLAAGDHVYLSADRGDVASSVFGGDEPIRYRVQSPAFP